MKKLKTLAKVAVVFGILFFVGRFLYAQEWGTTRSDIPEVARREGLLLPLPDTRLVISCHKKTMTLFSGDTTIKHFDIAIGRNQGVGSIWKGLGSTPLGEYKIVEKRREKDVLSRGTRFLRFNFPNEDDIASAWDREKIDDAQYERMSEALEANEPVEENDAVVSELGIQGNWFQFRGFNVTSDGSLAMRNSDINELFEYVSVGTEVIIRR